MAITLYDFTMAPSPRRARILLAEKNVPFERVIVDLKTNEQLSDTFRAINPLCTVPALKLDDGTVLPDNAGIAAYLEAAFPNPPLMGTTATEKGLVASWNARVEFEGLMAVAEALRNSVPGMKDRALTGAKNFAQVPELAARGLARLDDFFDMLDARLQGRDFIAIDSFSLADITAIVAVDFARVVRAKPKPEHENLARWRAALALRGSMAT